MKLSLILLLVGTVGVTGCGAKSDISSLIKNNLKDPSSAQFKGFVFSEDGLQGCVEFNSKNSFGGYTEYATAYLTKINGKWILNTIDASPYKCSTGDLAMIRSYEVGNQLALEALQQYNSEAHKACYVERDKFVESTVELEYVKFLRKYVEEFKLHASDHEKRLGACQTNIKNAACGVVDECHDNIRLLVPKPSWM